MAPEDPIATEGASPSRRADRVRALVVAGAFLLVGIALVGAMFPVAGARVHSLPIASAHATSAPKLLGAVNPSYTLPALTLGIAASPKAICAFGLNTCPAAASFSRVTLTADAGNGGVVAWPAVQVAFVVETTLYDGVYDPNAGDSGSDPCASSGFPTGMPCEESNGVPFFVAHAQQIANGIAAANPKTTVSFAMVDYFATCNFDDCDGSEYHVDIQNFVPSSYFGSEVQATFQAQVLFGGWTYGDSDFSDNILHSSVITAMYGTIIGSGLSWSNNTHHVIVWMGSSAPRDPAYSQNYCVSASDYSGGFGGCMSATCEPSYQFKVGGASPNCEGWIHSQDGNVTHSIAALAHTAPACTTSVGGVCTVDTIDLVDTATDAYSKGWPSGRTGGGPGGYIVQQDVDRVLLAGCDMAAATGGTWEGPAYFTCPSGQTGTLQYLPHGPADKPNTNNPTLYNAFRLIGFGPVLQTQVAAGTNKPIFQFVPFGNIALPAQTDLQATATCLRAGVPTHTCQRTPQYVQKNGITYLGWNWSTNKTQNVMYVGDYWTAAFNVYATGPPYAVVPVDACITTSCKAGGSAALQGYFTLATYVPYTNNTVVTESFPLAQVNVQFTPAAAPPPAAPPPPAIPPPGLPVLAPVGLPITQPIGVGNTVGVANVSVQATAAGFLAAGFMRVSLKNKPIAMKIAAKSGPQVSKFDKEQMTSGKASVGRFE